MLRRYRGRRRAVVPGAAIVVVEVRLQADMPGHVDAGVDLQLDRRADRAVAGDFAREEAAAVARAAEEIGLARRQDVAAVLAAGGELQRELEIAGLEQVLDARELARELGEAEAGTGARPGRRPELGAEPVEALMDREVEEIGAGLAPAQRVVLEGQVLAEADDAQIVDALRLPDTGDVGLDFVLADVEGEIDEERERARADDGIRGADAGEQRRAVEARRGERAAGIGGAVADIGAQLQSAAADEAFERRLAED